MASIEMLQKYSIETIAVFCFVLGTVIKNTQPINNVIKQYIPIILFVVGGIGACVLNGQVSFELFIKGTVSAFISTGFYETIKHIKPTENTKKGGKNGL